MTNHTAHAIAEQRARLRERWVMECQTLGREHPHTLLTLAAFTREVRDLEAAELAEACALQRELVDILRRVRGESDISTLDALRQLGGILRAQGELGEASEVQQTVLDLRVSVQGPNHPETLVALFNLYQTVLGLKDLDRVNQVEQQGLRLWQQGGADAKQLSELVTSFEGRRQQYGLPARAGGTGDARPSASDTNDHPAA